MLIRLYRKTRPKLWSLDIRHLCSDTLDTSALTHTAMGGSGGPGGPDPPPPLFFVCKPKMDSPLKKFWIRPCTAVANGVSRFVVRCPDPPPGQYKDNMVKCGMPNPTAVTVASFAPPRPIFATVDYRYRSIYTGTRKTLQLKKTASGHYNKLYNKII